MTSESDLEATARDIRVGYIAWCRGEITRAQAATDFDRFIARVKAEALRDARDNVRASSFWADGSDNYADRVRGYLSREAERIEKETGL